MALVLFDFGAFKAINDEFAVIAPGARSTGVARIVAPLDRADQRLLYRKRLNKQEIQRRATVSSTDRRNSGGVA